MIRHLFSSLTQLPSCCLRTIKTPDYSCLLCEERSKQRICTGCLHDFFYTATYQCQRCALPLAHPSPLCGDCLQHRPYFISTIAPFTYCSPLSTLIMDFKNHGNIFSGQALATLFTQAISERYTETEEAQHFPDLIVPVPLHWKKHYSRGFNQSTFFAKALSKAFKIPLFTKVERTKAMDEQKQSNKQRRRINVKESFSIAAKDQASLSHQRVAIIDDVMTTGATVNALAKTLLRANALSVSIWVLARTPKQ